MAGIKAFRCGHPKTKENSKRRTKGEPGVQCNICRKAQHARWQKNNPDKVREIARRVLARRVAPRMKEQKGRCAICRVRFDKKTHRPYLDHNHVCCPAMKGCDKCRRGLLCPDCNTKLAAVEKPGWIKKAKKYLKKWSKTK